MIFRFASIAAMASAVAMASAPLAATELPELAPQVSVETPGVFDAAGENAADHRRWGHRDGVDAGDVIAGVAVVGVIAALANAVSKQSQRDARRTQGYPYPERPYDYRATNTDTRYDDSRGIDRAVDACTQELGRGGAVDTVERTGNGWHVAGRLQGGSPFDCSVDNAGRVEGIDRGGMGMGSDHQWDDGRYAAARQVQDGQSPDGNGVAPPYPGGPVGNDDDHDYAPDPEPTPDN